MDTKKWFSLAALLGLGAAGILVGARPGLGAGKVAMAQGGANRSGAASQPASVAAQTAGSWVIDDVTLIPAIPTRCWPIARW
jgi:hypothetical protein